MEFLTKNQKRLLMTGDGKLESNWDGGFISAEGKDVIVIGVSLTPRMVLARAIYSLLVRVEIDASRFIFFTATPSI